MNQYDKLPSHLLPLNTHVHITTEKGVPTSYINSFLAFVLLFWYFHHYKRIFLLRKIKKTLMSK